MRILSIKMREKIRKKGTVWGELDRAWWKSEKCTQSRHLKRKGCQIPMVRDSLLLSSSNSIMFPPCSSTTTFASAEFYFQVKPMGKQFLGNQWLFLNSNVIIHSLVYSYFKQSSSLQTFVSWLQCYSSLTPQILCF